MKEIQSYGQQNGRDILLLSTNWTYLKRKPRQGILFTAIVETGNRKPNFRWLRWRVGGIFRMVDFLNDSFQQL